jgi:trk system potassium uptake protein TrkA
LLIVMTLKELGIENVIGKATTAVHGRILEKIGVSRVIFPERDMGIRLAHSLTVPSVVDYIELSRDFSLVELPAPEEFVGRTLRQLELRQRHGLTLVAIRRMAGPGQAETTRVSPGADEPIQKGDILILLGSNERLARLEQLVKR